MKTLIIILLVLVIVLLIVQRRMSPYLTNTTDIDAKSHMIRIINDFVMSNATQTNVPSGPHGQTGTCPKNSLMFTTQESGSFKKVNKCGVCPTGTTPFAYNGLVSCYKCNQPDAFPANATGDCLKCADGYKLTPYPDGSMGQCIKA
jgi:hypothetical protein